MGEGALSRVHVRYGARIIMHDGVALSATIYTPMDQGAPRPAILTLTPYIAQTFHDKAMAFAEEGFPFVIVDVRGRGNSDGEFVPFRCEKDDGPRIVAWIAAQPFCDGQVAMWGGSYGGFAQWMTATSGAPALKTIVPVASPYLGVDLPGRGNIPLPYMMQWLTLVWGRASQDKLFWNNVPYWGRKFADAQRGGGPFTSLDELFGFPSPPFQEWIAHPEQGPYWDAYNPTLDAYAALSLPILTITGAYDGDQPGALHHYRLHTASGSTAPHFLVIGPWDHAGTRTPGRKFCDVEMGEASLVDMLRLHVEWYRWTTMGGARPEFLRDKVAYYVAGADRWRYAASLDAVTAQQRCLEMTPDGADYYVYDPRDTSLTALESDVDPESRADQRMVLASAGRHCVCYTPPFARPCEVAGFFSFEAWISIDQPDTDFKVSIDEVMVDGKVIALTHETLRARYRNGLDRAELVKTTEPLKYDFNRFTFISREIAAGSRLRVIVGPAASIYSQRNYNSGGAVASETAVDGRPVTVKIFHDHSRPTALYIPLGQDAPLDWTGP